MTKKLINFSKYSSIKIGQIIEVDVLEKCSDFTDKHYLLGSCNNTLIGTNPPPLMILSKKYDFIKIKNNSLIIGGATPSGKVASFCKKYNIANLEFVSHLPGTFGGLVYMNAGLKEYEIFESLICVRTCEGIFKKKDIKYGYRYTDINSPIIEVTLELKNGFSKEKVEIFKKMRSNQPSSPSAGSCFKNPKGDYAGRLIEAVGLKGFFKGDMCFSQEHANFLVNHGKGNFDDALYLIKEAKKRVFIQFSISLECEIIILDDTQKA